MKLVLNGGIATFYFSHTYKKFTKVAGLGKGTVVGFYNSYKI